MYKLHDIVIKQVIIIFTIVLRSVMQITVTYVFLLYLTRLMGRKLISQMTFFDFVVGVIVGSVAANMSVSRQSPFISGLSVLFTLTSIVILIEFLNLKSFFLLKTTDSEPLVIIENGKLIIENMKKERLALPDLMMLLREKNTFNIADVEYAIFETDGKLSVLLKSQKRPVTPEDMGLPTKYIGLTRDIVMDGRVMTENLRAINLSEEWLINEIKNRGIADPKRIFYAGLDTQGNLYLSLKEQRNEKNGEHGLE